MKETILAAALAIGLTPATAGAEQKQPQPPQKPPAKASVEVMAGHTSATLDAKLLKPLDAGFAVFNRSRMTVAYEGAGSIEDTKVTSFHHAKVIYGIPGVPGLAALAGADFVPGVRFDPRVGFQYSRTFGVVSIYQDVHIGLDDPKKPDVTLLTNVTAKPALTDNLKLVANAENVTNANGDGHGFSTQRLRLALEVDGYQVGAAVDLIERGPDGTFEYNAGGFLKADF